MGNASKQALNGIVEKRVEGTAVLEVKQTPEYIEIGKQIDESLKCLKESFTTSEQGKMLQDIEDAWNRQRALYLDSAYRQGLVDGAVLQETIKKYEHLAKRA